MMRTVKLFFSILLLSVSFFFTQFAHARPDVSCIAWNHNQTNNYFAEAPLKKTDYDPEYYAANIGQYSFGADYSYLSDMGIGLIIYDNKSSRFTSNTVGFRRLGKTKHYEATTSFYDQNEMGETVVAGILCGYEEP